jgi:alkylhydroperoxidase family enzyme
MLATMYLTPLTPELTPAASRPILDGIAADLGLVPNLAATVAASPTMLAGFDALRRAVAGAKLEPLAREVAGVAVGVAVDNHYGVAFHSTVLAGLGAAEDDITRMRAGGPPADERLAAVYCFARSVALDRGKVDEAVVDRIRDAGYGTEELLEIVTECTFAGLVGVIDNLAGQVPLDAFLAPRAWDRVA